jgi:hypothetical protein
MHYSTFNRRDGQAEFRNNVNPSLAIYDEGYTISEHGERLSSPEMGMSMLKEAGLPKHDPDDVEARVEAAVVRFRRHHSSLKDRKHALRDLADVLEYLRPKLRQVISSKDKADLANVINNFRIRHHNQKQKTNYATSIWYSWMFYYFLATIHACVRLIEEIDKRAT